jgi:hypothetical protein
MSFRDVPEVLDPCQSKGVEINNDLDQQAVERELRHYEEDGISKTMSPVEFWEVGLLILWDSDISAHMGYITEA